MLLYHLKPELIFFSESVQNIITRQNKVVERASFSQCMINMRLTLAKGLDRLPTQETINSNCSTFISQKRITINRKSITNLG